jgi:diguanylate cyclase (GGDEF)-like protein/PAS domain S-box-containing protein
MPRSPHLTRRSFAVFAAAALLAVGGAALVQVALSDQRRHYEEIGAMALQRQLASRLVRGALLASRRDTTDAARARTEAAPTRRALAAAHALLTRPVGSPAPNARAERALWDAAGGHAPAIAGALDHLLLAASAAADPAHRDDPAAARRARADTLLAAERQLAALTGERTRALVTLTDRELADLRRSAGAATALLLLTLAWGALFVVRPAAREMERLIAELLASGGRLEAASRDAMRGREFAASLVASAADAIYAFDTALAITEWNPAMAAWTGVSRAAALGQQPGELAAELDWGDAGRPYARALAGETTTLAELAGRARPGAPSRWFDVTCAPLRDPAGAVTGGVVTVRDVTERVAATERLRASEARFHALYHQAPLGIITHDDDGVIRDANPAFERLIGRPVRELRGLRAADLSPPEDGPVTRAPMRAQRDGQRSVVQVEKRFVRATGEVLWTNLTLCRVDALGDGATTVGMIHDISERKALEARLSHQAYHDPLTGLANRVRLRERVEAALARADAADVPARVAVLYVDLDNFKKVNDSLGHAAGDRLLGQVADRLLSATRGCDTVARLGGDEFAVLLERVLGDDEARVVAERVGHALRAPFRLDGTEVVVGASVGIARLGAPADGATAADAADALLRDADLAMYAAKRAGKGRHALHEPAMNADASARLALEAELRHAIAHGELRVYYQPIVELATGHAVGAEALVRWEHPRRGLLAPGAFIPLAEETGLVVPLGAWVLAAACAEAAGWGEGGDGAPTLTVNVSARQLDEPGFVDAVAAVLARTGLRAHRLLLELTESVLAQHDGPTLGTLRALKALGVRLGIDDFGTGYSSLRYLQRFPVDVLKVDRSFVAGLGEGPAAGGDAGGEAADGVALARAVLALGSTLSLRTVAEGVETEGQRAQLLALGCEYGQGYLFARPAPGAAAAGAVRRGGRAPRPAPPGPRRRTRGRPRGGRGLTRGGSRQAAGQAASARRRHSGAVPLAPSARHARPTHVHAARRPRRRAALVGRGDAARAVAHGHALSAALVTSTAEAICAFDLEMRVAEWNPAMARLSGLTREQVIGRMGVVFQLTADWTAPGGLWQRALGGHETVLRDEPWGRRWGNTATFVEGTVAPLRAAGGAVVGGVMTLRDVSERVGAAELLRASEARFRSLFDQAAVGIVVLDAGDVIRDVNPAFEHLLGYSAAELVGRRSRDLSPPEDAAADPRHDPAAEVAAGRRRSVTTERRLVRKDGAVRWVSFTVSRVEAFGRDVAVVGMAHDVTARKALEIQLEHQAYHDPLTSLGNRALFRDRLARALAGAGDDPARVAVFYADLDNFKQVNDTLGHAAGDRLLAVVADRLLNATRGCDTVARLGGDEFAVLVSNARADDDLCVVADRVVQALAQPVTLDAHVVVLGGSVGIARAAEGEDAAALLGNADAALYTAKHAGKGRHALFARATPSAAAERAELEAGLREALERGELRLRYQPIVDLATERVAGVEALVRWQHPARGLLAPGAFLKLAEETGLILPVGRWVLREACRQGAAWQAALPGAAFTLTVNVSGRQLLEAGFVEDVAAVLAATGLTPGRLLLEITESVFMDGADGEDAIVERLRALKLLGVRLGIDDFGTGYSSLGYLQRFPARRAQDRPQLRRGRGARRQRRGAGARHPRPRRDAVAPHDRRGRGAAGAAGASARPRLPARAGLPVRRAARRGGDGADAGRAGRGRGAGAGLCGAGAGRRGAGAGRRGAGVARRVRRGLTRRADRGCAAVRGRAAPAPTREAHPRPAGTGCGRAAGSAAPARTRARRAPRGSRPSGRGAARARRRRSGPR